MIMGRYFVYATTTQKQIVIILSVIMYFLLQRRGFTYVDFIYIVLHSQNTNI